MAGTTRLRIRDASNSNFREWTATAAATTTTAGLSIVVTVDTTSGGVPPGDAETLTLRFLDAAGTQIRSTTITGALPQDHEFHFTDTGNSGGTARCGTVEPVLRATRTTAVSYDVETDGSPNTPPTGFTTDLTRGWMTANTTATEALSNVSAGGAKNQPAEYDESLFARVTSGAVSYVARALTVALSHGSLSGATNSTTAAVRDVTFTAAVDERFPAASTSVGISTITVPNATVSGAPDWAYTTTTDDTITVDPRLTCSEHHFQLNNSTFDPALNDTRKKMLTSQYGGAATRIAGARGTYINGLSVTQTADPTNPGATVTATSTTATRSGQAGWTDLVEICPNGKPSGAWTKNVDVTAPSDIDGDTYLMDATDTITVSAGAPFVLDALALTQGVLSFK